MNADEVIEGIGKAAAAANSAQEYCLFYWNVWPMCMTKAEWASWMQALGVVVTLIIMLIGIQNERKKHRTEVKNKQIADSVSMKYYLRQHDDFCSGLDAFILSCDLVYADFQNNRNVEHSGQSIEKAIDCFRCTEEDFTKALGAIEGLQFNQRSDLHLNVYAGAIDNIISSLKSLGVIYFQYSRKKQVLEDLSQDRIHFDHEQCMIYWGVLQNMHREWEALANACYPFTEKINVNWKKINEGMRSI